MSERCSIQRHSKGYSRQETKLLQRNHVFETSLSKLIICISSCHVEESSSYSTLYFAIVWVTRKAKKSVCRKRTVICGKVAHCGCIEHEHCQIIECAYIFATLLLHQPCDTFQEPVHFAQTLHECLQARISVHVVAGTCHLFDNIQASPRNLAFHCRLYILDCLLYVALDHISRCR